MSRPRALPIGPRQTLRVLLALAGAVLLAFPVPAPSPMPQAAKALAAPAGAHSASGWTLVKFPAGQPACAGVGFLGAIYYDRLDCGFGYVQVSDTTAASIVRVSVITSDGAVQNTQTTTFRAAEVAWEFDILPTAAWAPGEVTIRVTEVDADGAGPGLNQTGNFGETTILFNQLGASISPTGSGYTPGSPITVTGSTYEIDQMPPLAAPQQTPVGATFSIQVVLPTGQVRGPYGPYTASDVPGPGRGAFTATLPAAATAGVTATADSGFKVSLALEVVDATYADALTGAWAADRAGAGSVTISVPPTTLVVENSFVSDVGWVKPGATYPFRLFVRNFTSTARANVRVTVPVPDGTTFTTATPITGSGTCVVNGAGAIAWNVGSVAAAGPAGPTIKTCVVLARADTTVQDPQIVWKNLSSTATLTYNGGPGTPLRSTSHGPKVIPERATFDTARYGDRPFPVVPVDYFDRAHLDTHTGDGLSAKINSPQIAGSTFNLYQEMSYGQLFPHGTVPSTGIATAGWDVDWKGDRYTDDEFEFTSPAPQGTCKGTTYSALAGTPLLPERITDGWYQMPGDTEYYGGDRFGSALVGAVAGVGAVFAIDDACGPTGKAVYDAAHIADPEIDYSDYDTDKDGVVDFFMMVYVGVGGHGASQTSIPPYDNIWPHSSSLEFYYTDAATGLKGYISDDQLKDLQGRPLYYTNAGRGEMTTAVTTYPVYVRVGPYNVNPEDSIDHASVISHEYGHSLGLPDFYSTGGRETYGDWNLMATDKSQNMDVFSRQELGWLIPRTLPDGVSTINNWPDSKLNTRRIDWVTPGGVPYSLTGASVNNGQGYVFKLPSRQILDPAKFNAAGPGEGATPDHVWWSQSGNDFGCAPQGGHNLDVFLPELATLPTGTPVTVTFKSLWDIEWDYDYGFVMASTDGGETYQSLPSGNDYTTPMAVNPTANACQAQYGNGITGTSGSYEAGTEAADRLTSTYPDGGFLSDSYDLSSFAGESTVLRFSYATDPGLSRPGWFIDDLVITAGSTVIFETDFETSGDPDDPRMFSGGCKEATRTAAQCTDGWQYISASAGSPADHAYYLEMRDRSSFDESGKGENDRDPIAFAPGLLVTYTDEAHCYGNPGCDDPPGQSPLDSEPEPGNETPNLHNAAFTEQAGKNHFSDSGAGHTDNYTDPSSDDGLWHFRWNCLTFDVLSMGGRDIGPATVPPYNLSGNVRFTVGADCADFDYGSSPPPNTAPTAAAQARPMTADVDEEITFDGSASFDAEQAPNTLTYAWDLDGDSTFETNGQVVTHAYDAPGTYTATLRVTDDGGLTDTDSVTVTVGTTTSQPDLAVTQLTAVNNRDDDGDFDNDGLNDDVDTDDDNDQINDQNDVDDDNDNRNDGNSRQSDLVTITATIANLGSAAAGPTQTEFLVDGVRIALVNTPAIPAGGEERVSATWDTRSAGPGPHQLSAIADALSVVAESDESNNRRDLSYTVQPNAVDNGSAENDGDHNNMADAWSPVSTGAGTAAWSSGASHGLRSLSLSGSGGSVATAGAPSWTSAPIPVQPGALMDLQLWVSADGSSSAASAGLVYLGPLGQVLDRATLLTAPLGSAGFSRLEQAVTIPAGVAHVRIVLLGFAATDTATAGTVTFDDIGLFAR